MRSASTESALFYVPRITCRLGGVMIYLDIAVKVLVTVHNAGTRLAKQIVLT